MIAGVRSRVFIPTANRRVRTALIGDRKQEDVPGALCRGLRFPAGLLGSARSCATTGRPKSAAGPLRDLRELALTGVARRAPLPPLRGRLVTASSRTERRGTIAEERPYLDESIDARSSAGGTRH